MKFQTKITKIKDGEGYIRGESMIDMIGDRSFSETIYFLFKGDWPNDGQKRIMDAILVSCIDHGPGPISCLTTRIVTSSNADMSTAVAAGILTIREKHGGVTGDAAKFFQENINCEDLEGLLRDMKDKRQRVPGYGHSVLKVDKRAEKIFEVAKEVGVFGKHCEFSLKVFEELNKISSKHLPINVDAAIGAVFSDMGFHHEFAKAMFIISRVPGLISQSHEEANGNFGLRRLSEDNVEYIGD